MSKIKPSANVIRTLGKDLIKDNNAALIELVKNSYDADSENVNIEFTFNEDYSYTIIIDDHGHGMSENDIIEKWLVPAYSSKKDNKTSPNGRSFLGRKGIGRFSAQILGRYFTMITKQSNLPAKKIEIDWTIFDEAQYLDEIDIEVIESSFDGDCGTRIIINSEPYATKEDLLHPKFDFDKTDPWNIKRTQKFIDELRMILTPIKLMQGVDKNFRSEKFDIWFKINNKPVVFNTIKKALEDEEYPPINGYYKILPYDIFDLYDYRIKGHIRSDGYILAEFSSRHSDNIKTIDKYAEYEEYHSFGNVYFDVRVIDRDKDSLDEKQKLFYKTDTHIGRRNLAALYNQINGINIFRGNFALKPYSEGFDWLDLDRSRVQKTTSLGHNQTMGYVYIEDEDDSNLIEKSARDGLKETPEYESLKKLMIEILDVTSDYRMDIRHAIAGGSKSPGKLIKNVEETLDELDLLKLTIAKEFSTDKNQKSINNAIDRITKAQNNVKQKMNTLSEVLSQYEKNITLGKMVDIIIHEVRRSLQWFSDIPTKLEIISKFIDKTQFEDAQNFIVRYNNTTGSQLKLLSKFMKTLDPLSRSKKRSPQFLRVTPIVNDTMTLFQSKLESSGIIFTSNLSSDFELYFDSSDLYLILANLVENSIYWLNSIDQEEKEIKISSYNISKDEIGLLIFDNGPGINKNLDNKDVIFEPGFSMKTNVDQKTGLGLSIAGEAASRNNYKLSNRTQNNGCLFSIDKELVNGNN